MSEYGRGPHVAVDVVVYYAKEVDEVNHFILLIQRKDGQWALPGGFVDPEDTSLDAAARRELLEETGLDYPIYKFHQANYWPRFDKGRDPRSWVISFPFWVYGFCEYYSELPEVKGMDDAKDARWFTVEEIANMDLFLDHKDILRDRFRELLP